MRLYLVPNKQMLPKEGEANESITPDKIFRGANILQSFKYCDSFTEEVILPNCKNFLLDSGAYSFFSGRGGDWDKYIERYAAFINRNKIERFFELDIDSIVGYERVKEFRDRLEQLTGRASIPVWHYERGRDEWLNLCENYDYVAVGGLVKEGSTSEYAVKYRKYFPWFINTAHERGAKIHALGFTALLDLEKYHFDSVDSSTWSAGNRYGHYFTFDGRIMKSNKKPNGARIANHQALSLHNFLEWKKFAEYAEVKL